VCPHLLNQFRRLTFFGLLSLLATQDGSTSGASTSEDDLADAGVTIATVKASDLLLPSA
jgi:hypothetical protein